MARSDSNRTDRLHVTETPDVSHIKNVDVVHETSDINVSAVLKFVLFLTLMTIAVFILMWALFRFYNSRAARTEPEPGPMALTEQERLPPEPRLQLAPGFAQEVAKSGPSPNPAALTDPAWEIKVLRQNWEDALQHGVRDQNGNMVGVPIDEAMKRVLQGNALPVRPNAGKPDDYVIAVPSAASSGRVPEKRLQ
ncbi:MAG: hypothetical protein C5B44_06100 [Acidobacteria bacterium]|nr:MAG: hypothetical protein C5B44_06100 [Acidobacteriota bacterium]